MYGIVEISGHQYRVAEGDIIDVQKLNAEAGSTIDLEKVLFIGGDSPKVGAPTVVGAKITAEVVRHERFTQYDVITPCFVSTNQTR